MKLMIRFANQIVGAFIILALGILVFVVVMLGSNQRWFSRDYQFVTYVNSASGLSPNMAVQHRGFTIGHVKSIRLEEDDRVEVVFSIFDTYIHRVVTGSLVELIAGIGGIIGGQFVFYPGLGDDPIPEGELIPEVNSPEGQRMLVLGLATRPESDDDISSILSHVNTMLGILNEAFEGSDRTSLGRSLHDVEVILAGLGQVMDTLPEEIDTLLQGIMPQVENLLKELDPILASLAALSERVSEPDSSVMALLDAEGEMYAGLNASLHSVSGILQNLEKTTVFLPSQMPQVISVLDEVEKLLVSLTNNPLLRGGVPQRVETRAGGAHARDMEF